MTPMQKLYQRAGICALRYGAYALAYLAAGDASMASLATEAAQRLSSAITAVPAVEETRLLVAVWAAEAGLSALDATLVD